MPPWQKGDASVSVDISTEIRKAGHALINQGRPVFPISGQKIPFANCDRCRGETSEAHRLACECLTNGGLCHGFYAATLDHDVFDTWLDNNPEIEMIAVPTGQVTGLFVFEFDPKNGGQDSYDRLVAQHGVIDTETNKSPSGGLHHWFVMPNFDIQAGIIGKLWPGVDIKGTGGYALVPPSLTDKGVYTVVSSTTPQSPPEWLRTKIFEYQSRNKWDSQARMLKRGTQKAYDPDKLTDDQKEHVARTVAYWQSRIVNAEVGRQNILIFTGTRVLFSLCYHGYLDEEDAQTYLEDACEEGNHPYDRSMYALASGRNAAEIDPDPLDEALSNDINILETFAQDDLGNANRVCFWRGSDIRYDVTSERYHTWADTKWVKASDGRVRNIVEDVHAKIISTEASFYSDTGMPAAQLTARAPKTYRELFVGWAKQQRYAKKIQATAQVLTGRESLWCTSDDFNVDPYHLNVSNGVVDLRTGDLLPHTREFMCTSISNDVMYDPHARAPEWERFLKLTQPNKEHRDYLQRLMGYTLIGEVIDQIFSVHIGSGGNGKGVFLDCIAYVMGEYARVGQRDSFTRKSNSNRIPADIAAMEGKRMVFVDELNDNQRLDEALLKDLTGGGTISAEAKNVNPWEYTPKFTLHFRTNHMPDLPSDRSIVRRFRPVKWDVEPSSEEWDTFTDPHHSTPFNFLTKQEASGILNWLLEGTAEYLRKGLQVPEDLSLDAVEMLQENDPFLIFMKENLVENPGASLEGAKLSAAFGEWHKSHRFPGAPPSSKSLYKDIKDGKYKGNWKWEIVRERLFLKDVSLNTLLVK